MQTYRGLGVSEGVAIGKVLKIYSAFVNYPRIELSGKDKIPFELERLAKALEETERQLDEVAKQSSDLIPDEFQNIFSGYQLFLQDKQFIPVVKKKIENDQINAEWALIRTLADLEEKFSKIPDPYIRARFDDVRQLGERLMKNLQKKKSLDLSSLKEPVIIVCHDLSPADAFHLNRENILGLITELGGPTSHSSILARAMGIPAVVGVTDITHRVNDQAVIILDGNSGEVIDEPTDEKIDEKVDKQERISFYQNELEELIGVDCQLSDNHPVDLAANLDFIEELPLIRKLRIHSIGLVRTEFLFFLEDHLPNEDEQYELFLQIAEETDCDPITIRTWDFGADKSYGIFEKLLEESNPALGLRAIRICLAHPDLFRVQIRAILRVSMHCQIKLMIPLVTRVDEVTKTKELIEQEILNLGLVNPQLQIGCMIETPAAVFLVDELLDSCDFLSIGTNDLVQYALAVDRQNEQVAELFAPFHPAVLKMLSIVVNRANRRNKPVAICGEMAADPVMQMFLLGVGEITLSMSPNMVLQTKKILSQVDSDECKRIAFRFLNKHSLEEADAFANELRTSYAIGLAN